LPPLRSRSSLIRQLTYTRHITQRHASTCQPNSHDSLEMTASKRRLHSRVRICAYSPCECVLSMRAETREPAYALTYTHMTDSARPQKAHGANNLVREDILSNNRHCSAAVQIHICHRHLDCATAHIKRCSSDYPAPCACLPLPHCKKGKQVSSSFCMEEKVGACCWGLV
jgi:hypothetical protein